MAKSSIHILPVKSGSESHNNREKKLNYVREDLTHLNSGFSIQSIKKTQAMAEKNYLEKVGQKMQKKTVPVREGVLLIEAHHTTEDLKKLGVKMQQRFGMKTIQAYCHKDEGHYDKMTNDWKPNLHGHMVFDWTDSKTGKSIKMSKEDFSELQTLVASELGMERGISSSAKHVDSLKFRNEKKIEELKITYKFEGGLENAQKLIEKAEKVTGQLEVSLKELEGLRIEKEGIDGFISSSSMLNDFLKEEFSELRGRNLELKGENSKLEKSNSELEGINSELKADMEFLEEKTDEKKIELEKIEKIIEKKTSQFSKEIDRGYEM